MDKNKISEHGYDHVEETRWDFPSKMDKKHTPTPWSYRVDNKGEITMISLKFPMRIFESCKMEKANANYIIKAVNNFESLLKALKRVQKEAATDSADRWSEINEAITKAESHA